VYELRTCHDISDLHVGAVGMAKQVQHNADASNIKERIAQDVMSALFTLPVSSRGIYVWRCKCWPWMYLLACHRCRIWNIGSYGTA